MVHFNRRARTHFAAGSIALIAALALTGCTNPIQSALDEVIGSRTSGAAGEVVEKITNGAIQGLGSAEIPDDFPSIVPRPERQPTGAVRNADQDGVSWLVLYAESSGAAEAESLGAELVARGFTEESNTSAGGAISVALYANAELTVSIGTIGEEGARVLQILVMQGGEK